MKSSMHLCRTGVASIVALLLSVNTGMGGQAPKEAKEAVLSEIDNFLVKFSSHSKKTINFALDERIEDAEIGDPFQYYVFDMEWLKESYKHKIVSEIVKRVDNAWIFPIVLEGQPRCFIKVSGYLPSQKSNKHVWRVSELSAEYSMLEFVYIRDNLLQKGEKIAYLYDIVTNSAFYWVKSRGKENMTELTGKYFDVEQFKKEIGKESSVNRGLRKEGSIEKLEIDEFGETRERLSKKWRMK